MAVDQTIKIETTGFKLQNQTKIAGQKLLYGLDYTDIIGSDSYNLNTMLQFPTASQQLYGVFIQDSWDISKQINISAGTRYNAYASNSGNFNNSGELATSQLALNYNFLDDWSGYASFSQGFSVPTIQDLYMGGVHPYNGNEPFLIMLANPDLKPQLGNNKMLGLKYNHQISPNQNISATASMYLNDVSNYILRNTYVANDDGLTYVKNINISQAKLYGYILSLNYSMPYFAIDTNFTQGYGKVMSAYVNDNGDFIPAGSPLPIPQAKGYVGLNFPIIPIDSLIKVTFNYALNQDNVLLGTEPVNSYLLTGINYSWTPKGGGMKGFNAIAGIDNLFNENYQQYDGLNAYTGLGRNIYLQINYRY
jgi:hemoglobin/transferrin/lactoferrin receptor protein